MTTAPPTPLTESHGPLSRILTLLYGTASYALFLFTFLYMIGFLTGALVPKTINDGAQGSVAVALTLNVLLLGLFALQHTVMARPGFKAWWTRIIPAVAERSTYVLITSAILLLMVAQWRPFPGVVWQVDGAAALAILGVAALGWSIVLVSTFLIDHFELFGLKQSVLYALGRPLEPAQFRERLFYRVVRHPLMLGFIIAFWATPLMTWGHLLFAAMTTGYILLALVIEERTLVELHGEAYEDYRRRVPKLIPSLRRA
jgi:protein-S-isoprenylcysteine O-methyltransferase Ste14